MARRAPLATSALLIGLLVAVTAVAVLAALRARSGGGDAGSPVAAGGEVAAFAAPGDGPVAVVDPARVSVVASTVLAPAGDIDYEAANTIDGDATTAWNSDSPDRDGRGERLTYRFVEPVDLRGMRFVNGYAKNPEIFAANHRLQRVRIVTDGAERSLTLLDTSEVQEITHDFGLTSKVVVEVLEVYPGAGFDDPALTPDLALSEVSFLAVQ